MNQNVTEIKSIEIDLHDRCLMCDEKLVRDKVAKVWLCRDPQ